MLLIDSLDLNGKIFTLSPLKVMQCAMSVIYSACYSTLSLSHTSYIKNKMSKKVLLI